MFSLKPQLRITELELIFLWIFFKGIFLRLKIWYLIYKVNDLNIFKEKLGLLR